MADLQKCMGSALALIYKCKMKLHGSAYRIPEHVRNMMKSVTDSCKILFTSGVAAFQ